MKYLKFMYFVTLTVAKLVTILLQSKDKAMAISVLRIARLNNVF